MSFFRLIVASLLHHWRTNLAVAGGVAAGTAVLTGALLVGDSMKGSLRRLTLERLGPIEEILLVDRFFREELADELAAEQRFKEHFAAVAPVIFLNASLENAEEKDHPAAHRVNLLGCDDRFWQDVGKGQAPAVPDEFSDVLPRQRIVLSRPLADDLGVKEGDWVVVRMGSVAGIPAESLLGEDEQTVESTRRRVVAIIPAEGPGCFSLRPDQQLPLNAFVPLSALQGTLGVPDGRVNALLVTGRRTDGALPPQSDHEALQGMLRPSLGDYGIQLKKTDRGPLSYFNITSDRVFLSDAVEDEITRALSGTGFQPVLTYLANKIDVKPADPDVEPRDQRSGIPYSTITAIEFAQEPPLGPFRSSLHEAAPIPPLGDRQGQKNAIVLNRWAWNDLGKPQPGTTIYVRYFLPESTHGEPQEREEPFTLADVVELDGAAADPDLTPTVPKVTDQDSLADWQPPFEPFYWEWLRDDGKPGEESHKDEDYWTDHKATPKAFVSLAAGRKLWGSRFGQTTSIGVRPDGMTLDQLEERLLHGPDAIRIRPAAMGFAFQPVKRQGLEAARGTTDFNVLFLALSFFVIAAAVMLVALLFRLGIEQRAGELGILTAVGFTRRRIGRLLAVEGLLVATLGSLMGMPAGLGYAALMVHGLQTWWVKAIVRPFLSLYVAWPSLLVGLASGVVVAQLAILWTVRRTRHVAPRQLLAGEMTQPGRRAGEGSRYARKAAWLTLVAAIAFGLLATVAEEMRAAAFFAAGAMVLAACLTLVWVRLRSGTTGPAVVAGRGNLLRIALRNAARNPGRSTLTIGLVASASFLIVAISAFRLDPVRWTPKRQSGNGGFALVAESDQPIYEDLDVPAGGWLPQGTKTIALRVAAGDDASCLNLYKPTQPRILGVPEAMIARGGFAWAGSLAETPRQRENPWLLLEESLDAEVGEADDVPLVPMIIEKNTATYSLHLGFNPLGKTYDVTDGRGKTLRLKIVGLLSGSLFQGELLISEKALLDHFPDVSGYRFFLTETPPGQSESVQEKLQEEFRDYGFTAEPTGRRLDRFLAVQNTYLLTFSSLGGLGLLLGTFGLATVQLRNVLQRRGELALLRAAGFRRFTLAELVMLENGVLLCAGLGSGVLAALVAVLPHWLTGGAAVPGVSLATMLAAVLLVGLLAGLLAVRAALTAPLLPALRRER